MPTADGSGGKRSSADRSESTRRTMADISHQNPYTTETLGTLYRRGPAAEDDGAEKPDDAESTMDDVDHTPRNDDVNHVWTRGVRGVRDGGDGCDGRDGREVPDGHGDGRDDSANEEADECVDGDERTTGIERSTRNERMNATKRTNTDVSRVHGDH